MKIVPVICFALATAVAGSMLPASSSYALTYPTQAQNCVSTGSTYSSEGVGNCRENKAASHPQEHNGSAARAGR